MKQKLLLLLLFLGFTSCGSLDFATTASTNPVYTGTCAQATYEFGNFGWGWYDCYGRLVSQRVVPNQVVGVGPRVVIRPRRTNTRRRYVPKTTNVATPRGSRGSSSVSTPKRRPKGRGQTGTVIRRNPSRKHN